MYYILAKQRSLCEQVQGCQDMDPCFMSRDTTDCSYANTVFSADIGGQKQTVSANHTPTVLTELSVRSILRFAAFIG
jgi:hypothetical protein